MDNWLILQNFCNDLTPTARGHIDAAAGGSFFSLTITNATQLIEKMVSNQGWSDDDSSHVKGVPILSRKQIC
jgi:hypothetical protein